MLSSTAYPKPPVKLLFPIFLDTPSLLLDLNIGLSKEDYLPAFSKLTGSLSIIPSSLKPGA
jgi:hypothetical protein